MSLAGEAERKIVRDIVRRARDPVKARLVPPEIVAKYRTKLANIEPDVTRVLEEEQAEREIARLENRANRLQNTMENGGSISLMQLKSQAPITPKASSDHQNPF